MEREKSADQRIHFQVLVGQLNLSPAISRIRILSSDSGQMCLRVLPRNKVKGRDILTTNLYDTQLHIGSIISYCGVLYDIIAPSVVQSPLCLLLEGFECRLATIASVCLYQRLTLLPMLCLCNNMWAAALVNFMVFVL